MTEVIQTPPAIPATEQPRPVLKWISVPSLQIDERYQRDTMSARSRSLVKRISGAFNWSKFQTLTVADNEDGTFNVIDGQHRAAALMELGVEEAPCLVVETVMLSDEAASFVGINKDRVRLNEMQLYHAGLVARDPDCLVMSEVCRDAGVTIPRTVVPLSNQKPGETMAVKSIGKQIKVFGAAVATEALSILRDAWPDVGGEITAPMIKAVTEIVAFDREGGESERLVDRDRLIATIRIHPSEDWQISGRALAKNINTQPHKAIRMQIVAEYNKRLHSDRRLPWDR
jgi:hypothetical protein